MELGVEFGLDVLDKCLQWSNLYSVQPNETRSPYFSPDYYHAYQLVEPGKAICFWAIKNERNYLFYPTRLRSVNELGYDLDQPHYDLCGAYGYNGPTGMAEDPIFIEDYNNQLEKTIRELHVITEFTRYCPITGNRLFHLYTEQTDVLDNVYINLCTGLDHVWEKSFEYRVRKTVRKGESYGLRSVFLRGPEIEPQALMSFYDIYTTTMSRNEADEFYFFAYDYIESLVNSMGEMVLLVLTFLEELALSTELVLLDKKLAFGYLGGTRSDCYQYKANTFQRWELLKHLHSLGIEKYSMGGSASRGDGIHAFKQSFARDCENPFYIGTKVHLPDVYAEIQSQWRKMYPEAAKQHANKIQGYRIRT